MSPVFMFYSENSRGGTHFESSGDPASSMTSDFSFGVAQVDKPDSVNNELQKCSTIEFNMDSSILAAFTFETSLHDPI